MHAEWTIMYYGSGAGRLSDYVEKNLAQIEAVGSSDAVNFVCQYASRKADEDAKRFRATKGGRDLIESVPNARAVPGDPDTLTSFVEWVKSKEELKAEKYGLVLLGHGTGWDEGDLRQSVEKDIEKIFGDFIKSLKNTSNDAVRTEVSNRFDRALDDLSRTQYQVLFRSTAITLVQEALRGRAVFVHDFSGHALDTIELGRVIDTTKKLLGVPLEFVGFDACLMASAEVAYQLRHSCKYVVASEQVEPGDGWPHTEICLLFAHNGGSTTEELLKKIPSLYVDSYRVPPLDGLTMSVSRLEKTEHLGGAIQSLIKAIHGYGSLNKLLILGALENAAPPFKQDLFDLRRLAVALSSPQLQPAPDKGVTDAAKGVLAALSETVASNSSNEDPLVAGTGGLTIYVPDLHGYSRYYDTIEFGLSTGWKEFLAWFRPPRSGS